MKRILHILTKPDDALPVEISELQAQMGHEVSVIDLSQVEPGADYRVLLDAIFQADNVSVW